MTYDQSHNRQAARLTASSARSPTESNARRQDGQSLVELALVVPLFILLLIGTTEFARLAWATVITSSAARAGAQYGAQNVITASDTTGIQSAASGDSTNLSGIATTSSHSCYCSTAVSTQITCSTALTTCPAPATIQEYVKVNTSITSTPLSGTAVQLHRNRAIHHGGRRTLSSSHHCIGSD